MKNTTFSVAEYLVYAMLAVEQRTIKDMAALADTYVSTSHMHSLINAGIEAKEVKVVGREEGNLGPPARIFALSAVGKKKLARHRKRLKALLA